MTLSADAAPTADRELMLTRMIDAPREKVFRAWTDPDLLKQWFAPLPYTTPVAETDVRPHILGDHRVKFKCQAMPLKNKLGGIRLLFSHNVQFLRSAIGMGKENVSDMDQIIDLLPVLAKVRTEPKEKIQLVSNTIIEEVLQDIGVLDFGDGITCKANVAIWRTRGEHRPLIGEFAYQFKVQDRDLLSKEALRRAEAFFIDLQYSAEDYIALNCTKTATVYRLLGNPPKSHE